jgi:hypothetical protein
MPSHTPNPRRGGITPIRRREVRHIEDLIQQVHAKVPQRVPSHGRASGAIADKSLTTRPMGGHIAMEEPPLPTRKDFFHVRHANSVLAHIRRQTFRPPFFGHIVKNPRPFRLIGIRSVEGGECDSPPGHQKRMANPRGRQKRRQKRLKRGIQSGFRYSPFLLMRPRTGAPTHRRMERPRTRARRISVEETVGSRERRKTASEGPRSPAERARFPTTKVQCLKISRQRRQE